MQPQRVNVNTLFRANGWNTFKSVLFQSDVFCFVLDNFSCEVNVDFGCYYIANFLAIVSFYLTVSDT